MCLSLDNGMVHYFTTTETTTAQPNIISGVGINTELSIGETASVTVITTAAAAGYSTRWKVDGLLTGITTSWVGGSEPTTGNASGLDTYALTLIKISNFFFIIGNLQKPLRDQQKLSHGIDCTTLCKLKTLYFEAW